MPLTSSHLAQAESKNVGAQSRHSLLRFFLWVFALSVPLWVLGGISGRQLLPGLPLAALMVVCPLLAASIVLFEDNGRAGAKELLKRAFDYRRIEAKLWFAPILLLMPVLMVAAYAVMRALGLALPAPHIPFVWIPVAFAGFFIAALGEELGWSGFAFDRMQSRWGALHASLLLGLVLVAWHLTPLLQAGRPLEWIAWWSVYSIATRVLTVWCYIGAGRSVFAASLFHASSNVSWLLFPNLGSHWDPRITAPIVAAAAVAVIFATWPGLRITLRPR